MPDVYSTDNRPPKKPVAPEPKLPKSKGPAKDVRNSYYLNDYRNRYPFKSEEPGIDYEWDYGSTFDLQITIADEENSASSAFPYVTDVLFLDKSVVDKNKVAHLPLSTMAYEDKGQYLDVQQVGELLSYALAAVEKAERNLATANAKYTKIIEQLIDEGVWPLKQ